tara:strand:+ start:5639 stop:6058 length:420 start_codon:yes stop_codon:yes gene_type:complete
MPTVTVTKTRTRTTDNIPVTQTITVEPGQQTSPSTVVSPPTIGDIVIFGAVCAIISYGLTQVFKSFVRDLVGKGHAKPWYYVTLIRVLAIFFGGLCGWLMRSSFGPFTSGFAVGVGCAAGVLSTTIVAAVKAKIKKAVA